MLSFPALIHREQAIFGKYCLKIAMKKQKYSPQISQPYYSDNRQGGAVLHRYLDDQFISRFTNQAQANQLAADSHHWLDEDRFDNKDKPCLRLPVHRTFYIVCCEANCNAPGHPAFDPGRIESAGFVIRQQLEDGKALRWMVKDGIDIGWDIAQNMNVDEPDEYRYLLDKGYTVARSPEPAYSGEKTYPLSPIQVSDKTRQHTLLYGFLPLGGQSYPSSTELDKPQLTDLMKELTWPLGSFVAPVSSGQAVPMPRWVENKAQHSGHLIKNGEIQQAAAEFLALLVERFHFFKQDNDQNAEIIALLNSINFYWGYDQGENPSHYRKTYSVYHYLKRNQTALENWLIEYHIADDDINAANAKQFFSRNLQLFITQENASALQLIIARRSLGVVELALSDLPEPRYQRESLYYAKTFLRYRDAKGCLKIVWGESTIPFYVAAPFDPDASRPHLIQMPELKDLTKGLANGAALRVPKSLADVIESIKPDLGDPGKNNKTSRSEGGWMYVFSIPILTTCAMILLMVLVNLLNFIFRWIPWVILRIPIPK